VLLLLERSVDWTRAEALDGVQICKSTVVAARLGACQKCGMKHVSVYVVEEREYMWTLIE
jgi:hypothetical protein